MSEDRLKVLFVCDVPEYRGYKMAKGLMATGECDPYLLAARWDRKLHEPAFARTKRIGSALWKPFSLYRLADLCTPKVFDPLATPMLRMGFSKAMSGFGDVDIVHTITPPVTLSKLAISCSKAPAVFDQRDLILQSYGPEHRWPREIEDERWCFEHAKGFVHKGPKEEIEFYRNLGYRLEGPNISYPDGCDESLFRPIGSSKLSDADGEWHVVYAGGIQGQGTPHYLLPIFESMASQGIHVHVYPASWSQAHEPLDCYRNAGEGRVHLHAPLPYPQLVREIAQYDFGIYYFDIDPEKFPSLSKKMRTASGNKIPAYFEAGLPVIIGEKLEYSAEFIRQDGAGLIVSASDIGRMGILLDSADIGKLRTSVERARNRLSLASQARRLLDFYRTVL